MRAVILSIAGLLFVTPVVAGSLQLQDTSFSPEPEAEQEKPLGLPSFSEKTNSDTLSFNAIGQGRSNQLFDLGGNSNGPNNGDFFQELQRNLSGAQQAAKEPTRYSD